MAGEVLGSVISPDRRVIVKNLRPCGHGVSPSGEVWDACAAGDFAYPRGWLVFEFSALRARGFALRRSLGRLRGARQRGVC